MSEGEAAVDFRFRGILRGEEGVEFFLGVDDTSVLVAEGDGAFEKILLDRIKQRGRLTNELADGQKHFCFCILDRGG